MANIYDVNAAIDKPNFLGAMQQGLQFGQQQRALREQRADQQQLRTLAPQVQQGDPGAIARAAAIDPDAAKAQLGVGDTVARRAEGLIKMLEDADTANPQQAQALWQTYGVPFARQFSQGTEPTTDWQQAKPMVAQLKARIEMAKSSQNPAADPTGFRELHMKALAAGYQPGTAEYQNAMRVGIGTEGRAATGGFGFEKVTGPDGRERMGRTNPRTGVFEIYDETSGDFTPMGGGAPLNSGATQSGGQAQPTGGDPFASLMAVAPDLRITSRQRTPEENAKADGVPDSYHLTGRAIDVGTPSKQQQQAIMGWLRNDPIGRQHELIQNYADGHWHLEPKPGAQIAAKNPALGVSQTPQEKAFAIESGQQAAQLGALPERGRIEAESARLKTEAEEAAKLAALPQRTQIEAAGEGQKVVAKSTAERVQQLQSSLPDLRQSQKALLDAYNGFKNGTYRSGPIIGAIPSQFQSADNQYLLTTINDQILATAERMKGTLSDKDVAFLKSATFNLSNDERANMNIIGRKLAIINSAIKRAEGSGQPQGGGPREVRSQAEYDALPSGAIYLEDGQQYRKP